MFKNVALQKNVHTPDQPLCPSCCPLWTNLRTPAATLGPNFSFILLFGCPGILSFTQLIVLSLESPCLARCYLIQRTCTPKCERVRCSLTTLKFSH